MQYSSTTAQLALIAAVAVVTLAGTRSASANQTVNLLPNGGGETAGPSKDVPAEWFAAAIAAEGLQMGRATEHVHSGDAALFIRNTADYEQQVSNNWAQQLRYVPRGQAVRVRGWVRTEDADAANICVQCWGPDGQTMIGFASTPVIKGTSDWRRVTSDRLVVPEDTAQVIVRAALTGKGRVDFDDVALEIVGAKALTDPGLAPAEKGRILKKLPLVKDSMILAYLPDWKHGNVDNIGVDNNDGGVRTLVQWKTPPATPGSPNRRYVLAMYSRDTKAKDGASAIQMHEILDEWDELISWKEQPKVSAEPAATFELETGEGWKLFDVTSIVDRQAKAGGTAHGVMIRFKSEDRSGEKEDWSGYQWVSREGIGEWQSRRPVLMVVDPDQPAAEPKVAKVEQPLQSVLLREQFLEYVEYLALLPGVKIHSVPGDVTARFEAAEAAGKALAGNSQRGLAPAEAHVHMHLLQLPPYERFVAAYPLTPEGVLTMSSILSWSYLQANLKDEAMQIAVAANRLAEGSEVECITAINLAFFESQVGEPDQAETRLRQVMKMPLPKAKDRRTSDIRLAAPLKLADILSEQGKWEEADRVYRDVIERGFEWEREYPNDQIGASYATSAYRGRLNGFVKANPDDAAGAEKLIEEMQKRVPGDVDELRREVKLILERLRPVDAETQSAEPDGSQAPVGNAAS